MKNGPGRPPKFPDTTQANIRIGKSELDALDKLAKREGLTRTDAICQAIRDWTRKMARKVR